MGGTVVLDLPAVVTPAHVPRLCERLSALLVPDGGGAVAGLVVCDVAALSRPDAVAVEALARLQLTAMRCGSRLVLRHAGPDLLRLLTFAGLGDVVQGCGDSGVQ
jgi:hypothetical protein